MRTKRLLGILVAVCMLISMLPVVSSAASAGDTFTAGDFTYTVNTDTSTVTLTAIAAESLSGEVVIPSTVSDGTNTYTVTILGAAFKGAGGSGTLPEILAKTNAMTKLVMADTITTITPTSPFYGCRFTEIHLSSNLDTSDHCLTNYFYQCNWLYTVNIPSRITGLKQTFKNGASPTNLIFEGTATRNFYMNDSSNNAFKASKAINIYTPYVATQSSLVSNISGTAGTLTPTYYYYEGDYRFNVKNNGTARIYALLPGRSLGEAVNIPSTLGGKTVSELEISALNNNSVTTSLTMPDTITAINSRTFSGWSSLTSVHLSTALTGTLVDTFKGCTALKSVVLPESVVGCKGTFQNSGVRAVTVTGTSAVEFYGASETATERAWSDDVTGIYIYYPSNGTEPTGYTGYFTATAMVTGAQGTKFQYGDFMYTINSNTSTVTLTSVAASTLSGAVSVPATVTDNGGINTYTVTAIGDRAFNGKNQVTSLTIPNTVTTLGYQAFLEMDSLTSFTMPDSVTSIDYGTFYGCNNLEEVKLSKNLTGTLLGTFMYCSNLNGCVIPYGVTTLERTFAFCSQIKTVFIPASVTVITGDRTSGDDWRRNRLFDTQYATGQSDFIVMGPEGSAIQTYMSNNSLTSKFKAVDTNMELALTDPKCTGQTAAVKVVNFNKTDETTAKLVICAYYDKTTGDMTDVGFENLGTLEALDIDAVTFDMQTVYNQSSVLARAFAWAVGTLTPLADYSQTN